MGIQCRAKDPNSCRVHGTSGTYERLQLIADRAALSGNTSLYMDMRAQMDALSDGAIVSDAAVDAAASIVWTPEAWQTKVSEGLKALARRDAREKLNVAAPYLHNGVVNDTAINAVAKHSYESRGNGKWHKAVTDDRVNFLRRAQKVLAAAAPHMTEAPHMTKPKTNRFAIPSEEKAGLEDHLTNSTGLNVIYRNKMRSILKSEDNEMPRLKELFDEITHRQDTEGVRLMSPEFRTEFVTQYNKNVKPENRI